MILREDLINRSIADLISVRFIQNINLTFKLYALQKQYEILLVEFTFQRNNCCNLSIHKEQFQSLIQIALLLNLNSFVSLTHAYLIPFRSQTIFEFVHSLCYKHNTIKKGCSLLFSVNTNTDDFNLLQIIIKSLPFSFCNIILLQSVNHQKSVAGAYF